MKRARHIAQLVDERGYDESAGDHLQLAMEVAAALGSPMDVQVWKLACEDAGVSVRDEWVDALVDHGLAARRDGSWCFSDDALPADLQALATDAGRWTAHHAACAQALYRTETTDSTGVAQRRSRHLEAAGNLEEAMEALLLAIDEAFEAGDFPVIRRFFERMETLLEHSGASPGSTLCARSGWRRARLAEVSGEPDTALTLVQRAVDVLGETNWSSECGHAELIQARILRRRGDLKDASDKYRSAGIHFAMCGDEHGLALSRGGHGVLLMLQAKHRLARKKLMEAIEALESQQLFGVVTEFWTSVAHTWLAEGDYVNAIECAERARDLAEEHDFISHQAMAWNTLGEIARVGENYEQAAQCYSSAVDLFERTDNLNVHIARSNLALVEVARGNFSTGRQGLESSIDAFIAAGLQSRLPSLYCGLMACAASEGDWTAWDAYRAKIRQCMEQTSGVDVDMAWAAGLASAQAVEHGRADIGAQALALAQVTDAELSC